MKSVLICIPILFLSLSSFADFNILAVGDTGKANEGQYAVARAMSQDCKQNDCKFVLLLGDNIYNIGITSPQDPQMIEKFEKPYADLPVPFYVSLGNHDYGKNANDWERGDHQVAYSKLNPKWILPSHYYSFEHEDVLFIVLDTARLFYDHESSLQIQFIRDTIARNTKKWIVAVSHHPYISNGKHGNAGNYDSVFIPPFSGSVVKKVIERELCPHVDVFFSGHDHSLQTLPGTSQCPNSLFVVSGGGAESRNDLKGKNKTYFQKAITGFTRIEFKADHMNVSHLNVNGEIEHTARVEQKEKRERL